jgi:excisionase family DNA binding protein
MEQYLFNLGSEREPDGVGNVDGVAGVRPNLWLMTAEELPPILFTTDEVARLLGIGKCRVYDLIRQRELRSVKVGASRRVSARALADYVEALELWEPA